QRVDAAVLVAGHHEVVRHGHHAPARHPAHPFDAAVAVGLGVAAERHGLRGLGVRELPRRAEPQPRVGLLDLLAVDERLTEDAVLVADAVADARHAHRGERVDEAGGQTPEPAVAQTRFDLLPAQGVDVDAAGGEGLGRHVGEPRGEQVVVELAPQQVLRREVAHALGLALVLPVLVFEPLRHQVVAHRVGQGEVLVVDGGCRKRDAPLVVEVAQELAHEPVDGARRRRDGGQGERVGGGEGCGWFCRHLSTVPAGWALAGIASGDQVRVTMRSMDASPTGSIAASRSPSPMSTSTTRPARRGPSPRVRPALTPPKVTVTVAGSTSPSAVVPSSGCRPLGRSTATTFVRPDSTAGSSCSTTPRTMPRRVGAPVVPVPSTPSSTRSYSASSASAASITCAPPATAAASPASWTAVPTGSTSMA